ncbi:hypothetical protein KSP40_PGU006086 [Platanthera guangdongensis]|uniref:Uncharacterized protein n=1 Tax=Platanthera guangdongensis TaxID=2320717 RepID=A0ABR2MYI7_9ASPA
MSALWEKSSTWRWLVRKTRDSKRFFFVFATMCGVVPAVIGYGVMQITNSRNEQLEAQLRKTARPESLIFGGVNISRLSIFLMELDRRWKANCNDFPLLALGGEISSRYPSQSSLLSTRYLLQYNI